MQSVSSKVQCFQCKKPLGLEAGQKIAKNEECEHCYASIHSCRMCTFYDQTVYNECREPNAERIVEKEKANFCDFFVLSASDSSGAPSKDDHLNKFNSLFKN